MDRAEIENLIQQEVDRRLSLYLPKIERFFAQKNLFELHVQFLDGRNVTTGRTTGTTLGTASDQKIGFHGSASTQHSAISAPAGGATIDSQARTAIGTIISVLAEKGITA